MQQDTRSTAFAQDHFPATGHHFLPAQISPAAAAAAAEEEEEEEEEEEGEDEEDEEEEEKQTPCPSHPEKLSTARGPAPFHPLPPEATPSATYY